MFNLFSKKKKDEICVVAVSLCSPLGIDGEMTAAMITGECKRLLPHEVLTDYEDIPLRHSKATYIKDEDLIKRIKELLTPALTEVMSPLYKRDQKLTIFAGLPEKNEYYPDELTLETLETISKIVRESPVGAETEVYCRGHSSGIICLEKAINLLRKGKSDFCIVGGVDSYIDTDIMYELMLSRRTFSSFTKHGFVPGEAAGFILITTQSKAAKYKLPVLAKVKATSSTMEEDTALNGKKCLGKGLSKAVSSVLSKISEETIIDKIYCDLNGERFRAEEYNYLISRNSQRLTNPGGFISTCKNYGDVGAATFPSLLNLAIHHNTEPVTGLFFTGSDSGIRSAAIIETEPLKES
ncbi:MAG: hypothetical protein GY714_12500 [Desulfobacterales bacterium]|nr:hypothetical protein [Desulfobacterales bacterium]